ncbi:MAG: cyclodeaminase/cyclohydrolase family protein [Chloroflexi bacterium]|nr:cyclodeaminase/cyclohydrolase family protein [Chloroflexota bacterium]
MSGTNESPGAVVTNQSIHAYLEALSAREPTPGGGSVAALVGALGAGLAAMVANFTRGRKKYAAVAPEVEERLAQLSQSLRALEELVQEDIEAYGVVGAGFAMPRGSDEEQAARSVHIQQASIQATEVLFAIADGCVQVSDHALWLAKHGNSNLLADAVMAVLLSEAALQGTVVTIRSSLGFIKDDTVVAAMGERLVSYDKMTEAREEALSCAQ